METWIVLLNLGEPATTHSDAVVDYLTRVFFNNADLEEADSEAAVRERSRELAERRASGLIEEHEEIGRSPLNEQADAQREAFEVELVDRGFEIELYRGMQLVEPLIPDVAELLADNNIETVIGLPVYPLCGPSMNVAALDQLAAAIDVVDGNDFKFSAITGWHRHPTYNRIRADAIEELATQQGLGLADPDTSFIFSAHGTPTHYNEEGSRYDVYVEEYCETIASIVGIDEYYVGYQNHTNRGVPWTEPEVEDLIESLARETERVVVDPSSFVHEQSETLTELDIDLREDAESVGLEFQRVDVPHDDPRLATVFANLVEPLLAEFDPGYYQLRLCQCRSKPGTYCLNV